MDKNYNLEVTLLFVSILWFLFVNTNVNPTLGITFVGFALTALLFYILDTKKQLPLEARTDNRLQALLIGTATWVIFIFGTAFIAGFLEKINVGALIRLLGGTTPALAQSKILNFITFGFVGFVETQLWARMYDYFANRVKIGKTELINFIAWAFILSFAFIFLLFHITAKGATNNVALLAVFLMMVTSYVLMFIFKETKQAVIFHVVANLFASYYIFFGGFSML